MTAETDRVNVPIGANDAYMIYAALEKGEAPEYLLHHFYRVVKYFEAAQSLRAAESWIHVSEIDTGRVRPEQ